ncbi:MAG: hypothetical protein LUI87_04740 [Lachnospiraceae bacterium]|nr:hypothetical protein [Lachnospiraceae bacterium]
MAQRTVCLCDGKYIGIETIYTVIAGRQINIPEKVKALREKSRNNELFCPCGCGSNLILVAGDKNEREQHFRIKDGSSAAGCTAITEGRTSINSKIILKCWLDEKLKADDLESRVPIHAIDDTNRKYEFTFLSAQKKMAVSYCHDRANLSDEKIEILENNGQGIHIIYVVDFANGGCHGQYPEGLMKVQNRQGYCLLLCQVSDKETCVSDKENCTSDKEICASDKNMYAPNKGICTSDKTICVPNRTRFTDARKSEKTSCTNEEKSLSYSAIEEVDYDKAAMRAVFYAQDIDGLWEELPFAEGSLKNYTFDEEGSLCYLDQPLTVLMEKVENEYLRKNEAMLAYREAEARKRDARAKKWAEETRKREEERKRCEVEAKIREAEAKKLEETHRRLQEAEWKRLEEAKKRFQEAEAKRQEETRKRCQEAEAKRQEEVRRRLREAEQIKAEEARKKQAEMEAFKRSLESKLSQQISQVRDAEGNRWIKCEHCGKIATEGNFLSYGGMGHINLGTCKECARRRTEK